VSPELFSILALVAMFLIATVLPVNMGIVAFVGAFLIPDAPLILGGREVDARILMSASGVRRLPVCPALPLVLRSGLAGLVVGVRRVPVARRWLRTVGSRPVPRAR
jgi:hypothetical protein